MPARLGLSPLSKALSMRRALNINLLPNALALAISLPVAGYVQAQEIELDIPAQPLGSALQAFGHQANMQVLYSPTDVQGKNSTAVKGKLDPQQAINTLLSGTSTTHSLNGNSLTVTAAGTSAGAGAEARHGALRRSRRLHGDRRARPGADSGPARALLRGNGRRGRRRGRHRREVRR